MVGKRFDEKLDKQLNVFPDQFCKKLADQKPMEGLVQPRAGCFYKHMNYLVFETVIFFLQPIDSYTDKRYEE